MSGILLFQMEHVLKHDKFVNSLCSLLDTDYDVIFTHVPLYSRRNRCVGEIDVLALKDGYCDVYEVKCGPRAVKAKKQLKKLRKVMSLESNLRKTFYYWGGAKQLMNFDSDKNRLERVDFDRWHSSLKA